MPESYVQLATDGTGKAMRAYRRGSGSTASHDQYVVPTYDRLIEWYGSLCTFRNPGNVSGWQPLIVVANSTGSTKFLSVSHAETEMDATAVLVSVMPIVRTYRCNSTDVTGGSTAAVIAVSYDTTLSRSTEWTYRCASTADGSTATVITFSSAASSGAAWTNYVQRLHTAVGQVLSPPDVALPILDDHTHPFVLGAGQALAIVVTSASSASNPATNHWLSRLVIEQFTKP